MSTDRALPALLRYWRSQRGLSQLDLSLNAGVSTRHLSFLETGRSRPSVEMVMLLLETLDVPLRSRNEVLRAAGFDAHYPDPGVEAMLNGPLQLTLELMLRHHEPFPMLVVDRWYELAATNQAAARFMSLAGLDLHRNVARLLFDPAARPLIDDWPRTASEILRRIQREVLHRPNDEAMADLLADLLDAPDVPDDWRQPDLAAGAEPASRSGSGSAMQSCRS
ncbi:MAG: helix-turn-helix domain-containing protein [Acidimicrobiales bacterium]